MRATRSSNRPCQQASLQHRTGSTPLCQRTLGHIIALACYRASGSFVSEGLQQLLVHIWSGSRAGFVMCRYSALCQSGPHKLCH